VDTFLPIASILPEDLNVVFGIFCGFQNISEFFGFKEVNEKSTRNIGGGHRV